MVSLSAALILGAMGLARDEQKSLAAVVTIVSAGLIVVWIAAGPFLGRCP